MTGSLITIRTALGAESSPKSAHMGRCRNGARYLASPDRPPRLVGTGLERALRLAVIGEVGLGVPAIVLSWNDESRHGAITSS